MSIREAKARKTISLQTPTDLTPDAIREISGALNILLADVFGLYLKTKNFHWHVSGPHFRDYHLLLDEQGDQIFATTDAIAERVRKVGGTTLRSIGHVGNVSWTTTQISLPRWTCSQSFGTTTERSPQPCAKHTASVTSTAMWLPRVYWKIGSMKPSGAPGSCLRPRGTGMAEIVPKPQPTKLSNTLLSTPAPRC
jgi:hypothetical protein